MYNIIICNYFISYIISIVMRCNELIYIYIYINYSIMMYYVNNLIIIFILLFILYLSVSVNVY